MKYIKTLFQGSFSKGPWAKMPFLDTNRPIHPRKTARIIKFWLFVEEKMYYLSSENKGADQLHSYYEADLCLCFCLGKNQVFL